MSLSDEDDASGVSTVKVAGFSLGQMISISIVSCLMVYLIYTTASDGTQKTVEVI